MPGQWVVMPRMSFGLGFPFRSEISIRNRRWADVACVVGVE